jgi:hypothetical protein
MNFLGKEWSGKFSGDRHDEGTVPSQLCNRNVNKRFEDS